MNFEKINQRLENIGEEAWYQGIGESFGGVMISVMIVQIAFLILGIVSAKILSGAYILSFALTLGVFLFFKDGANDIQKKIGVFLLKASPLVMVLSFVYSVMRVISVKAMESTSSFGPAQQSQGIPPTLILVITAAVVIGYLFLMKEESVAEQVGAIINEPLLGKDKRGEDGLKRHYEIGDMLIGKDVEITYDEHGVKKYESTDKNVIIPIKDRYLHMLIIGPTGSGKTSQVLIPQINRDVQNKDLGLIVLEPKGDLAEQVYAMGEYYGRSDVTEYFNPTHPDCPYFNPLSGPEDDVVENMVTTFKALTTGSSSYFMDQAEILIRNSITILKRMEKDPEAREYLHGDEATLLDLSTLIHNNEGKGKKMVLAFDKIPTEREEIRKQNTDISGWFLSEYLPGSQPDAGLGTPKTYEHNSDTRNKVSKLVSNPYLRRVLNPPKGQKNEVDFSEVLEQGKILALTTNQGKLRDLGRFLGYFLILQLQSAIFKRPGNEDTRRGCMLYIDEFQVYANEGFEDMLTQGRSYRVACHLATQAIEQISTSGVEGKRFLAVVKTNCRNLIAFPDIDSNDADWFSKRFGEESVETLMEGYSQQEADISNFWQIRHVNKSQRYDHKLQAAFTPTDIMQQPFGRITYKIITNNHITRPGVANVSWIDMELKETLDGIVSEYNKLMVEEEKRQEAERRKERERLYGPIETEGPVASSEQEDLTPIFDDEELLKARDRKTKEKTNVSQDIRVTPKIKVDESNAESFISGGGDDLF